MFVSIGCNFVAHGKANVNLYVPVVCQQQLCMRLVHLCSLIITCTVCSSVSNFSNDPYPQRLISPFQKSSKFYRINEDSIFIVIIIIIIISIIIITIKHIVIEKMTAREGYCKHLKKQHFIQVLFLKEILQIYQNTNTFKY